MDDTRQLARLKEALQAKIRVLAAELETVDRAIQLLEREHVSVLAAGHGQREKKFAKTGLSDTIRQLVGSDWILPSEVRNQMIAGGYKSEDKAALLSSVFATLKRLANNELEGKKIEGKMRYRKRQPPVAIQGNDVAA